MKKSKKGLRLRVKPKISTVISKNLLWIEKYLRRAKKKMPSLILPKYIRSYKPSLKKNLRSLGSCAKGERLITIATHNVIRYKMNGKLKRKRIALSQKEILMTLAHEMAHLKYFQHSFEQEGYAEMLFRAFGVTEKCPMCRGTGKVPAKYKH